MSKPEGEMGSGMKEEEYAPPGHHLDRQYCASFQQFQAGECRGCEKLCLSGTRYEEDEGKSMSCSCCDQYDCTDGTTEAPETEKPEGDDDMMGSGMMGSGMEKP